MTVWIYVDTSKQVGDRNHLKVFASEGAAETCKGVAFEYLVSTPCVRYVHKWTYAVVS
jgi:hypothetical protein